MTLPANVRVNTSAPFPSLVYSTGPVTLTKANGVWSVGFNIGILGTQIPPLANFPIDYLIVWDSVLNTHFKFKISDFVASLNIVAAPTRHQRFVTATPIVVAPTDAIINCRITTAAACTLPVAATRGGLRLTFKDLGQATTNNITITPAVGETIDGLANYVLRNNFAYVTLVPFADGTNTGWMVL